MSTTPDYPENVPDANKGTAQSLAAPSGAGVGGTQKCGQPYTHAAHYERSVSLAKLGRVLTDQHVQVLKHGVHYCARIRSSWTTPSGLDCWTVETIHPEIAHFTVPCKNVRLCGDEFCACILGG